MNGIRPTHGDSTKGGAFDEIPHFVQYTSPVSTSRVRTTTEGRSALTLPLNIIALITQHIEDVGDLARITRTCRLLYYMSLPNLYQRVSLHSYPELRYINGRPEGYGSGSPFTMALNGLVTKNHGALVEDFRIWGGWREVGQEDFAKGRVPDNSMMLNILLRAATDKMDKLRSFSWQLDCKPLKTLYQGLAAHNTLTSLTVKFPNSRLPRPSVMIPPMANLRALKVTDIDPLCYPDDLSMLLLHSRRLEDVRLHFSPRMRREAEPSTSFQTYFGRCQKAGYLMKVKHFAVQNFFGTNMEGMDSAFDPDTCHSVTFIDTFGGLTSGSRNVYIDDTWKNIPPDMRFAYRRSRTNEVAAQHVEILKRNEVGLEYHYFINAKHSALEDSESPITPGETPWSDEEMAQLGREYLQVLTQKHGPTLKHLLLKEEWALTPHEIGEIVRSCPNLEQLGFAVNTSDHNIIRLLLPFLPKMKAVRILSNEFLAEHLRTVTHEERCSAMAVDAMKVGAENLRFIGLGDFVYRIGEGRPIKLANGRTEMRRNVTLGSREDVKDIEIWSLDCLDLNADAMYPLSP